VLSTSTVTLPTNARNNTSCQVLRQRMRDAQKKLAGKIARVLLPVAPSLKTRIRVREN
jgi:hypothetical protein